KSLLFEFDSTKKNFCVSKKRLLFSSSSFTDQLLIIEGNQKLNLGTYRSLSKQKGFIVQEIR
ncbi:MAG TPA: hypothetical protein PLU73_04750, partial [Bacteroidia bacterium]|nr:hypothetical protein [Bacteroidia bacterium]